MSGKIVARGVTVAKPMRPWTGWCVVDDLGTHIETFRFFERAKAIVRAKEANQYSYRRVYRVVRARIQPVESR